MIVKGEMCSAVEACLASLLHQVLGNTALRQVNFAFFPVTHSPPFYLSVYLGSIIHCRVYRSNLSIDLSIDLYIDLSIHPSIDRSIMPIYESRETQRQTERQRHRERKTKQCEIVISHSTFYTNRVLLAGTFATCAAATLYRNHRTTTHTYKYALSSFHIVRFTQIGCSLQQHLQVVLQQHFHTVTLLHAKWCYTCEQHSHTHVSYSTFCNRHFT